MGFLVYFLLLFLFFSVMGCCKKFQNLSLRCMPGWHCIILEKNKLRLIVLKHIEQIKADKLLVSAAVGV